MAAAMSIRRPECAMRGSLGCRAGALRSKHTWRSPKLYAAKQSDIAPATPSDVLASTKEEDAVSKPGQAPDAPRYAKSNGNGTAGAETATKKTRGKRKMRRRGESGTAAMDSPLLVVTKPLPRVLILHTGGTLGMDPEASFQASEQGVNLKKGTGGVYAGQRGSGLRPGVLLKNVLNLVPELSAFANLELRVVYNKDSSNVGPSDWKKLATVLHKERDSYDAFLIIHGTDTMSYTASALSLMLVCPVTLRMVFYHLLQFSEMRHESMKCESVANLRCFRRILTCMKDDIFMQTGFRKPIIVTGSQLPLAMPRSDARQNLIDSVTCLTAFFNPPHVHLREVAVCFGGRLMRGNRCQKTHSSFYQAFDSLTYPYLANLGVDVDWNKKALLQVEGVYRPRFQLDPNVIRVPVVPGSDPNIAYGDLMERGVRGIVLETFGVGNMPDGDAAGWIPWLRKQRKAGLFVYLATQCLQGPLQPELYKSGLAALAMGVEAGPQMTPECAVIKMMQCLKYRDIPLGVPIAGEM